MPLNKCEKCGAMVSTKIANCPNCGNMLNPSADSASDVGLHVQQPVNIDTSEHLKKNDRPSIGLNVVSFLFPIVGWILYFVVKSTTKAKSYAKWGWIGFVANLILIFLS